MTKMLSASGGLCPPDPMTRGSAPGPGALPPDSRYRLVLRTRQGAPPTTDPFRRLCYTVTWQVAAVEWIIRGLSQKFLTSYIHVNKHNTTTVNSLFFYIIYAKTSMRLFHCSRCLRTSDAVYWPQSTNVSRALEALARMCYINWRFTRFTRYRWEQYAVVNQPVQALEHGYDGKWWMMGQTDWRTDGRTQDRYIDSAWHATRASTKY